MACEGKAAVLQEAGKDAEIIDTIVDSPGPGEVMVRWSRRACATPT
jgi:Zn-dependent alcohol dehydrogenase